MTTKFVFQFPGSTITPFDSTSSTPAGYDITNIAGGGTNGIPSEI